MKPCPGVALGPYEILTALGAGGMGEVWRARDTRLNRDVAIKVLPPDLARDAERRLRFEREARAMAALSHPNVIAVFDTGIHDGEPYIVEELLDGDSLRTRLRAGPFSAPAAVEIAASIARGLAAAHEKGIVHRDLKPENVFLTRFGNVKVLDFGLAKLSVTGPADQADTMSRMPTDATGAGRVLGTVGYMAPEQVRGVAVDQRADLFALGVVLHEMLTGANPFRRDTGVETLSAILKDEAPDLAAPPHAVPAPLARIVARLLEKDPAKRFQSGSDLLFAFELAAHVPGEPQRVVSGAPRRSRAIVAVAAVAVVSIVASAAWVGFRRGRSSTPLALDFTPVTQQRGTVGGARFTPDGQSVVYSACWGGAPSRLFLRRLDADDPITIGPANTILLSVSRMGELAVLLEPRLEGPFTHVGTLARLPISEGAPRPLADGVADADWTPDGRGLALVLDLGGRQRLEYPRGTTLYETAGVLTGLRFSPDGRTLAFIEHPSRGHENGSVATVDIATRKLRTFAQTMDVVRTVAWSPEGREIWYGGDTGVHAVEPAGRTRLLVSLPQPTETWDRASDGRVLLMQQTSRVGMAGVVDGVERDLSWLAWSLVMDLTPNGERAVFSEFRARAGTLGTVALRSLEGGPVTELGEGLVTGASPDGRWVVAVRGVADDTLVLLPIGAGDARELAGGPVRNHLDARFLPDSRRVVFAGSEAGGELRLYEQSIDGGPPRRLSAEPLGFGTLAVLPDGSGVVATGAAGYLLLCGLDGSVRVVPGSRPGDNAIRCSADRRAVFVHRLSEVFTQVERIDLTSGERTILRTLAPADPSGVRWVGPVAMDAEARRFAFSYSRVLSDLYVASSRSSVIGSVSSRRTASGVGVLGLRTTAVRISAEPIHRRSPATLCSTAPLA